MIILGFMGSPRLNGKCNKLLKKALEGAEVKLDGSRSSDPDDGIASYEWKQIGGPEVNLSGSEMAQCYFIAPDVEEDGKWLTFQLTVKDVGGSESTDICKVHVIEPKAMPWIPLLLLDD